MDWYEIKNKGEDSAEVWIYDEIGENFWGEGISAKKFVKELAALDVEHIDLHINSPGGNVFDGVAIYNAIKRHKANVTTYVDAAAFSISSIIALAGDRVIIAEGAAFMIHRAWALFMGNSEDAADASQLLGKIDESNAGIYARKTGRDVSEILPAMAEETWYFGQEAVDFGLADEVEEGLKAAALVLSPAILARFKHVPEALLNQEMPMEPSPSMSASPSPMMDEEQALLTVAVNGDEIPILSGSDDQSGGSPQTSEVYDFALERIKHRRKQ